MSVRILNVSGRLCAEIHLGLQDQMKAEWDGRDANGSEVPSGIYFVEVRSGNAQQRIKVLKVNRFSSTLVDPFSASNYTEAP
jgi:flagellar hook assembly protein FlgD